MDNKITEAHLKRKAIIYVRQSSPEQVRNNTESQRLQYAQIGQAKQLGFVTVEVVDEDLGRTASGLVDRQGFERVADEVCRQTVGAIWCIEDARLARNGREWHHLIDLCALTGTLLIDPQGVYDPRLSNDRLLLGLKGSMAEFELSLLRQRCQAAIRAKAERGELQVALPVGLVWTEVGKIELDPDRRVQHAIGLVFSKYEQLGSAYRVHQWFRDHDVSLPSRPLDRGRMLVWNRAQYGAIVQALKHPLSAGAYAYGRRETRTTLVEGKPRKSAGHDKPQEAWDVLLVDHHPGYIDWETYQRNQRRLLEKTYMASSETATGGRGGHSLLAGLLRCGRCGRKMAVVYKGSTNRVPRYICSSRMHTADRKSCLSFGGLRPDQVVAAAILEVVEPYAIEAAVQAEQDWGKRQAARHEAIALELEQARYEAGLAARRYEAVDPEQRLVAAELERRWEAALQRVRQIEQRLATFDGAAATQTPMAREQLQALATDLPALWRDPQTNHALKQRIARIVIEEVVANVDEEQQAIVLVIRWRGGRHSESRLPKNQTGHTGVWTSNEAVSVIAQMAGRWPDRDIALTLNRMRLRTGKGLTWSQRRVGAVRRRRKLPGYDRHHQAEQPHLSLAQAATHLSVSATVIRRLVKNGILKAQQLAPGIPWQIERAALCTPEVTREIETVKRGLRSSRTRKQPSDNLTIPGT